MPNPLEFEPDHLFPSLDEAREWLAQSVHEKSGAICPCCERFDKVYDRTINAAAVRNICLLYQYTKRNGDGFYHYKDFMSGFAGWDVTKFLHLGLVKRQANDSDVTHTSGTYRITESGKSFVEGKVRIPARLTFYHNELIGTSEELRSIEELWPDFNYQELMGRES